MAREHEGDHDRGTPEKVWPWLMQIGDRKAGWYSYDWVERAFGCRYVDGHSSMRVVPEFQDLQLGDPVWFAPRVSIRVTALEPNRHLVIGESWAFVLEPLPGGRTRFLVRTRGGWMHEWFAMLLLARPIGGRSTTSWANHCISRWSAR